MASGTNTSGRSPFPPTRSARSRTVRNSVEGGLMADDVVSTGSASHSPFVQGLLRYSPNNSSVWSPNSTRLPSTRQRHRFFEGPSSHVPVEDKDSERNLLDQDNNLATSQNDAPEIDGIPVQRIREIVLRELLQSPAQASFYASILYSKTHSSQDALLLAQAHFSNKQYKSCLFILEESKLLQSDYPWEALALACSALAATEEWSALAELVEDCCRLPDHDSHSDAMHSFARLVPPQPLEDEDEIGWAALQQEVYKGHCPELSSVTSLIHPLARVVYWRGQAYHAAGHFSRAALYWKRALKIDCRCQQAWEALLDHSLITPAEAHVFVVREIDFDSDKQGSMQWLSAIYMASIESTPQDPISHRELSEEVQSIPVKSLSRWEHTSSIQLASPVPHLASEATDSNLMTSTLPPSTVGDTVPIKDNFQYPYMAEIANVPADVDRAFDQLWNVYKLQQSPKVLALAARRAYRRYDWKLALKYCEELDQLDPLMKDAAYCYIATLVLLGHKRTLFRLAHAWVEASPRSAQAWMAIGAYYYCCERYHVAQRHFCRATRLDPQCTEAWIAFGCSFAACDESDQALASFRAAQRLSPGEHMSLLYMGIEYTRTNHLVLAGYFLDAATRASTGDPLCFHEIGVLAFQKRSYKDAIDCFQRALSAFSGSESEMECIERCRDPYWEPTIFNLGHAYRKTRQFTLAILCFQRCVALCPAKYSAYSALGFTKHLQEDFDGAIVCYHQALSFKPDDPFSTDMLNKALREALSKGVLVDDILQASPVPTEPFFRSWGDVKDQSAFDEAMDESDETMMSP